MDATVSLPGVMERLRTQIAHHREQERLHAEREAFHREQRASHNAELERLTGHLEMLEAAAATAGDLARQLPAPAEPVADPYPKRRIPLIVAVNKVLITKGAHEPFGPRGVAAEVNRRFRDRLKRPADERQVSVALRRLSKGRGIFRFEKGRPHHEAVYVRRLPPEE